MTDETDSLAAIDAERYPISVVMQPTFGDYIAAQRFHSRPRTLLIASILGAGAFLVWYGSTSLVAPILVVLYVLVLRPIIHRIRLRRHWDQTPSAHGGQKTVKLDQTGFHWQDDEGNPCVTHWDKFLKLRESAHGFLLYLGPQLYLSLPKRFISDDECNAIRQLLTKRIKQPQLRTHEMTEREAGHE